MALGLHRLEELLLLVEAEHLERVLRHAVEVGRGVGDELLAELGLQLERVEQLRPRQLEEVAEDYKIGKLSE